jgi:phospholipid/cholesterol/gamma-HCH transport system substrate-binding protein
VIAMIFAFIYWLHNAGGLGNRREVRVVFHSVSGLLPGSAVFFNGIRVGEVSRLGFRPNNPTQVEATLSIDQQTPLRTDTTVGLEFQGLTGVAAVMLVGASANAAPLAPDASGMPVLVAGPTVGQSLTQAAQSTLQRLNDIMNNAAVPLQGTLENVKGFSDALARNSDRVDGIMAGLERMTGGAGKLKGPTYDLTPPASFPQAVKVPEKLLGISELTAPALLDNDKILLRKTTTESAAIDGGQWSDPVPRLLQLRFMQSFENAGYGSHIGRAAEGLQPDLQLQIDLRGFQISLEGGPTAVVDFGAKILDGDGKIIAGKLFQTTAPAKAVDAPGATSALNEAFKDAAAQLVTWVSEALANTTPVEGGAAVPEPETTASPPAPG